MKNNIIEKLNWDKVDGLIPAIIQDHATLQVLMMGYMNQEALTQTIATGQVTFYSRTKQRLWTKGETSGNELILIELRADCDADTLLLQVEAKGPTCHLETQSCFGKGNSTEIMILMQLENVINQRYMQRPENSYVTQLFAAGIDRIAQKIGEEGVELALASVSGIKANILSEATDLIFHLLILLRYCQIDINEMMLELKKRRH